MSDRKGKPASKQKPEHTICCGEVTASIFLRQSNSGYTYYDFALDRSYRSMATGKELHGANFFERHKEELVQAVRKAAAWIREETARGVKDDSTQHDSIDPSQGSTLLDQDKQDYAQRETVHHEHE